jgi:cytochrome b
VILLLIRLAVTVWSGLTVYADDQGAGPLAGVVANARAQGGASVGEREDGERQNGALEARERYWEELHEFSANLTLVLVVLRIAGVVLASFVHCENVPRSMVSGTKRPLDK